MAQNINSGTDDNKGNIGLLEQEILLQSSSRSPIFSGQKPNEKKDRATGKKQPPPHAVHADIYDEVKKKVADILGTDKEARKGEEAEASAEEITQADKLDETADEEQHDVQPSTSVLDIEYSDNAENDSAEINSQPDGQYISEEVPKKHIAEKTVEKSLIQMIRQYVRKSVAEPVEKNDDTGDDTVGDAADETATKSDEAVADEQADTDEAAEENSNGNSTEEIPTNGTGKEFEEAHRELSEEIEEIPSEETDEESSEESDEEISDEAAKGTDYLLNEAEEAVRKNAEVFKRLRQTVGEWVRRPKKAVVRQKANPAFLKLVSGIIVAALIVSGGLRCLSLISKTTFSSDSRTLVVGPDKLEFISETGSGSVTGSIELAIDGVSIDKNLDLYITDQSGNMVNGVNFTVYLTRIGIGEIIELVDDDADGFLSLTNLEGGDYSVTIAPVEGYVMPTDAVFTVKEQVSYTRIVNISDKIMKEEQVDLRQEDPGYGGNGNNGEGGGTTLIDTVEWIDSSTSTKDVEKTVKVIYYTGEIGESGRLKYADGTLSDKIPEIDANGYLTGLFSLYQEPEPEEPVPEEPEPVNEPENIGGDSELFAKNGDSYVYLVHEVPVDTVITEKVTVYYGWQTFDGRSYYYDKNGNKVTGTQVIKNVAYVFDSDGILGGGSGSGVAGIDVSTYQRGVDWNKVKAAGIEFVIVRAGFRGWGSGMIVEDSMFYSHVTGAQAAGLKVGVYFFSQAINEAEAVEEASAVISLLNKYNFHISYPICIDTEWSGGNPGRADNISRAERTKVCIAFCETVRNAGYVPMIYASKAWLEYYVYVNQLNSYKIWLAHYTGGSKSSYTGHYEMWQYTGSGHVDGIPSAVDLNIGYLGY